MHKFASAHDACEKGAPNGPECWAFIVRSICFLIYTLAYVCETMCEQCLKYDTEE